jgi:hypothetical protein
VARDSLDPALRARAEAARALLREDPAVDRLSVLAAVVAPRDPLLEHVQPQGRGWRRTLGREAVERLFDLRDQDVSFGAIATQFHVHKSTLVAISQKAARDGREAVLQHYKSAATNGDRIGDAKLASLIAAELKRRLARWQPFPQATRKPRPQRPRQVRPPRIACLRGHEFTAENTIVRADGSRTCRACRRASQLAYYHRQRPVAKGNGGARSLQPDDLAALLRAVLVERLAGWEPYSTNGNGETPQNRERAQLVS